MLYEVITLVERTARLGKKVIERMNKWPDMFGIVGQSRGLGFLLGASIIDKDTGKPDEDIAFAVASEALDMGAWFICRITSYNVCYTKLLRVGPQRFSTRPYADLRKTSSSTTGVKTQRVRKRMTSWTGSSENIDWMALSFSEPP